MHACSKDIHDYEHFHYLGCLLTQVIKQHGTHTKSIDNDSDIGCRGKSPPQEIKYPNLLQLFGMTSV